MFDLRNKAGELLKKPTGWLSNLASVLDQVALPCPGAQYHQHGVCLGGATTKRAQVYTPELAKAIVRGLESALAEYGDERFVQNFDVGQD